MHWSSKGDRIFPAQYNTASRVSGIMGVITIVYICSTVIVFFQSIMCNRDYNRAFFNNTSIIDRLKIDTIFSNSMCSCIICISLLIIIILESIRVNMNPIFNSFSRIRISIIKFRIFHTGNPIGSFCQCDQFISYLDSTFFFINPTLLEICQCLPFHTIFTHSVTSTIGLLDFIFDVELKIKIIYRVGVNASCP